MIYICIHMILYNYNEVILESKRLILFRTERNYKRVRCMDI